MDKIENFCREKGHHDYSTPIKPLRLL